MSSNRRESIMTVEDLRLRTDERTGHREPRGHQQRFENKICNSWLGRQRAPLGPNSWPQHAHSNNIVAKTGGYSRYGNDACRWNYHPQEWPRRDHHTYIPIWSNLEQPCRSNQALFHVFEKKISDTNNKLESLWITMFDNSKDFEILSGVSVFNTETGFSEINLQVIWVFEKKIVKTQCESD